MNIYMYIFLIYTVVQICELLVGPFYLNEIFLPTIPYTLTSSTVTIPTSMSDLVKTFVQ